MIRCELGFFRVQGRKASLPEAEPGFLSVQTRPHTSLPLLGILASVSFPAAQTLAWIATNLLPERSQRDNIRYVSVGLAGSALADLKFEFGLYAWAWLLARVCTVSSCTLVQLTNFSPCALHPTPYTLHPTPYTLHPTPYTLHQICNMP